MLAPLVFLLLIARYCRGGDLELYDVPVKIERAKEYCSLHRQQLAHFDGKVAELCRGSETKKCLIATAGDHIKVFDASLSDFTMDITNCGEIICEATRRVLTDNSNDNYNPYDEYSDDGYDGYGDKNGFDPELVCMQYQYYVAISTLIMICFATFICMTIIILNKIKDHQTMVHVRI